MYLDTTKKQEIFGQYGKTATDTGSAEAQIALFSYRISHLTEHLKKNHKDYNTARSLTMLVGKRRKLLKYLYNTDINRYRAIVKPSVFVSKQNNKGLQIADLYYFYFLISLRGIITKSRSYING